MRIFQTQTIPTTVTTTQLPEETTTTSNEETFPPLPTSPPPPVENVSISNASNFHFHLCIIMSTFPQVNLCAVFPGSEVYWPDYEKSSSFIKCVGITPVLMNCSANLLFSFGCQVCVWPWDWIQPPPANEISPNLPPCIVDGSTQTSISGTTTTSQATTVDTTASDEPITDTTTTSSNEETTENEITQPPVDETVSLNFHHHYQITKIMKNIKIFQDGPETETSTGETVGKFEIFI